MKSAPKPAGHQAQVMTKKAVDVGHWMTAISGSCMVLVIFACGIGAFVPWWTVVVIGDDGGRASTGASLWVTVTTTQQQFKETRHVGCPDACDRTRVVQNKVRVSDQKWDDICRHSTGHLRVSCNIVWALRAGVGTALLVGFLYSTPAILSFSGTHQRSVCRFPPIVGVAMTAICVVVLATTIVLALALDTSPAPSGPYKLNGIGFFLIIGAFVISWPNLLLSVLAKMISDSVVGPGPKEEEPPVAQLEEKVPEVNIQAYAPSKSQISPLGLQTQAWA
eukprot:TRINITY_DN14622_c0_g1_i1.p1 TRINITY_DN14622_c0_g1~~TRINITY_DN14622_c0_g1_i1.p1  ORF type:complete len:278 (+),score=38.22 TRINITY_DN14622_c0_g1_i1:76-909(+)